MNWFLYPLAAIAAVAVAMLIWRQLDHRADRLAWSELASTHAAEGAVFDLSMVAGLPEPARRYFAFAIQPDTPLQTVIKVEMTGELGTGTKEAPNYQPMNATQILAPPHGLVWKIKAGPLSGSDGALPEASWTRFWLFGFIPVARVDGSDHQRSAFGRVIAEAAFWAPASLLPSEKVSWTEVGTDTARATVRYGDFTQAVDIKVDPSGAPIEVVIPRWSNENPEKVFRVQPFGGYPSNYQDFGGYRLPTRVEGGNHFGTPDYFPFFKANVVSIGAAR